MDFGASLLTSILGRASPSKSGFSESIYLGAGFARNPTICEIRCRPLFPADHAFNGVDISVLDS